MSFDPAQLEKVLGLIETQYGSGSVYHGGKTKPIPRISTGSLELDYATTGGVPFGRFSRFWGAPSSGKTMIAWMTAANAQKMGYTVAYYNAEKQYDERHAARLGVDVKKLVVVEGSEIETIATKMEALLGVVNLHIVDSCSSCISVDELNAKVEDWLPGISARAWGKVLRRLLERFDPLNNAGILIDQVRASIGAYGGGDHPPGGRALEHASSMTLEFRKGAWLYRNDEGLLAAEDKSGSKKTTMSGNKEADGQEYVIRVGKSRVGRPGRVARPFYDYDKPGFDITKEYARAGRHFGLIQNSGAWFTLSDGTRAQGEARMRAALADNPKVLEEIRVRTLKEAAK